MLSFSYVHADVGTKSNNIFCAASRSLAEQAEMSGGIEVPEHVDLRVDLVLAVLAKFGGRTGKSLTGAILDKTNRTLPKKDSSR